MRDAAPARPGEGDGEQVYAAPLLRPWRVEETLHGKFGIGFYSAPLVASRAAVTFKCNVDLVQHIWVPSADAPLVVAPHPPGHTLGRGSRMAIHSVKALAILQTPV